jgi:hypothetical protein
MAQQPWNPTTGINNYTTASATPAVATTTPADSATAEAATRQLNPDELISTQVNKVIAEDSPLMQQAAAKASQAANSRGLLNSSMAVQAGQAAVMDRALPIAQYDAGANTNVLNTNQANTQQTGLFNAGQQQDVNKFNTGEANKASIVNASEQNKILQQFLDQNNKLQLADIEASYKVLMQSEASAMTLYQQSVKNISEILMNPDLTAEAKTAAVNNQNNLLGTGMKIIGKMSGLNLDSLLTFPTA